MDCCEGDSKKDGEEQFECAKKREEQVTTKSVQFEVMYKDK